MRDGTVDGGCPGLVQLTVLVAPPLPNLRPEAEGWHLVEMSWVWGGAVVSWRRWQAAKDLSIDVLLEMGLGCQDNYRIIRSV